MPTADEAVGAWFSNPGAPAAAAPDVDLPPERAGVGKYLPAAAMRAARAPDLAPAAPGGAADPDDVRDSGGGGGAGAAPPPAKRVKAGACYGNFDAW